MIKQVSWAEYCTVLAVICAAYYIVIIILYYRNEVLQLFSGRKELIAANPQGPKTPPPRPGNSNARKDIKDTSQEELLFAQTNQLMNELNVVFEKEHVKGELIMALQLLLKKYNLLKATAFQVSVNNYIEMESENRCNVSLSEHELRGLWQG